jgi:hypothetical protein
MTLAASFFGSFLLFALLGLLALAVTAALDKRVGKEVALFLWAFVILGVAYTLRPEVSAGTVPKPKSLDLAREHDPSKLGTPQFDALARTAIEAPSRNLFQQQSDTSPLPPVVIAEPPPVPLAFPLPPTIPALGPASRRGYRAVPESGRRRGKLPDVPADSFSAYVEA